MSGYGVFMTHSGLIRMDAAFARALRDRMGLGSVAVVHGRRDRLIAEREQAFDRVVDIVAGFDPSRAESDLAKNLGILSALEQAKGDSTIFQDIYQDRWLMKRFKLPFQAAYLAHGASVLQNVLEGDVRVVMGEMTMALYRMARRMALGKAPYLYPLGARFYERFYFEDDLEMGWHRCCRTYDRYLRNGIPDEPRRQAEAVLEVFFENREPLAAFKRVKKYASPGAEPLHAKVRGRRLFRHLDYWRFDFQERHSNPMVLMSPWDMSPPGMAIRWARERSNIDYLNKKSLAEVPEGLRFCTYFLHYQPEYTVEGVGFPVAGQAVLIRTIAQCLPVDTFLLVKEQPWMTGRRPEAFYRSLLALPNVRLVRETVNSRELIKRSKCVFAISGTCALEALFLGVPAILFSRVFHSRFDGITRVLDLYSLPDRVRDLLSEGPRDTRKSSLAALAAMYSESYPGYIASEIADENLVYGDSNVRATGVALVRELTCRQVVTSSSRF